MLSWDRVDSATSYRVQGSETAGFSSLVFNQSTTNTSYVPTRVLKEGTLYWRVSATDATGTSGYADTQTDIFDHLPPTGITITPANPTAAIMPPVEPPVITWDGVPGAINYDVEMDAEGDNVGGTSRPTSRPRPTSGRTPRVSARPAGSRTSSSGCERSSTTASRRPGPST